MQQFNHDLTIPRHAAIQLSGTELIALGSDAAALILDLRACVHRSHGTPGTDPGAMLLQPVAIILPNGRLLGPKPALPGDVDDGEITAGGQTFDEMIPCPFAFDDEVEVNLTLSSGHRLRIEADGVTILFTGDPEFIGDFDGQ